MLNKNSKEEHGLVESANTSEPLEALPGPKPQDMEVHHHGHVHHEKKWKEYVFQFFMLFLAVFCGFLAEYQLEHTIEHQREKQYMSSLLEDLKSDTLLLADCVRYWDNINASIDSVSDAIELPPGKADFVKVYRHLNNALNYFGFRYNERTLAQLKNSGGFRLIRKEDVAHKIILYDQHQDVLRGIDDQHNSLFMQTMALRNKVFAQKINNRIYERYKYAAPDLSQNVWIDSMIKKNSIPLSTEEYQKNLFEFENSLLALRRDFANMKWAYDREKEYMDELILLIQDRYHPVVHEKD